MNEYIQLAKSAVETYVKKRAIMAAPKDLPAEFYSRRAGVFVTIYKDKKLRGCVGTYLPAQENLAREIINNAVAACSEDCRFSLIVEEELSDLSHEVSVLDPPKLIQDFRKHNPKKQGIIVCSSGGQRGLLLPDLKEIDSIEQQISIACQKAGINSDIDILQLYHFTIEKHA